MEDAVQQIARRYDLNKAQEDYTRLLLTRRVRAFLKLYEDDVRKLLKESIDFRLGLKTSNPEALMDWAERAVPVYEAARQAILDGNNEWGAILTEKQKETHKKDLDQMEMQFNNVSTLLKDWRTGKGVSAGPARPVQGQEETGLVSKDPAVRLAQKLEDNWAAYVERFIQTYQLDEKQQNSARSGIYREMLETARRYRDKRKTEFDNLNAELKVVGATAQRTGRREELQQRKKKLEDPLREMFVQMDRRLRTLPNETQLAAADPDKLKQLGQMYDELSGQRELKTIVGGSKNPPDTQPATTRPTETIKTPTSQTDKALPPSTSKPATETTIKTTGAATTVTTKPAEPSKVVGPPKPAPPADKPKIPDPPKP